MQSSKIDGQEDVLGVGNGRGVVGGQSSRYVPVLEFEES